MEFDGRSRWLIPVCPVTHLVQYAVSNYVTMHSVPYVVVDGQAKGGRDVIGGGMAAGPTARRLMY